MEAAMEGWWRESGIGAAGKQVTEDIETARLCRALIEAGKKFKPLDRAQMDVVFQRIVTRLREDEERGIPVARLESPSEVVRARTAKLSG
jgi:hypothetical protein